MKLTTMPLPEENPVVNTFPSYPEPLRQFPTLTKRCDNCGVDLIDEGITNQTELGRLVQDHPKDTVKNLKEDVQRTVADMKKSAEGFKQTLNKGAEKVMDVYETVTDKGEELKEAAKDKVSDILGDGAEKVKGAFIKAGEKGGDLKDIAKGKISDLKEGLSEGADKVKGVFAKVGEKGEELRDAAKDKIVEGKDTVINKGEELKDAAKDKLTEVKGKLEKTAEGLMGDLANAKIDKTVPEKTPTSSRMWFFVPFLSLVIFSSLIAMSVPRIRNAVLQFGRPLHRPVVISHHREQPVKVYDGNEAMARIEEPLSKQRRKAI